MFVQFLTWILRMPGRYRVWLDDVRAEYVSVKWREDVRRRTEEPL